jgi:hypothetical protein
MEASVKRVLNTFIVEVVGREGVVGCWVKQHRQPLLKYTCERADVSHHLAV